MDYQRYTNHTALSTLLFPDVIVQLSLILYHPLYPAFSQQSSVVHFLSLIEKLSPLPPNAFLLAADVTSVHRNIPHDDIATVIHFMEEYKHLLPTNCPTPNIVYAILNFFLKYSTLDFMDRHIH